MQKIRKILRAVSEIFKDGLTDHGPRTDMGDYKGPSRVNPMSKIRKNLWTVSEIFKDGRTNGQTNEQTRTITTDPLG